MKTLNHYQKLLPSGWTIIFHKPTDTFVIKGPKGRTVGTVHENAAGKYVAWWPGEYEVVLTSHEAIELLINKVKEL